MKKKISSFDENALSAPVKGRGGGKGTRTSFCTQVIFDENIYILDHTISRKYYQA